MVIKTFLFGAPKLLPFPVFPISTLLYLDVAAVPIRPGSPCLVITGFVTAIHTAQEKHGLFYAGFNCRKRVSNSASKAKASFLYQLWAISRQTYHLCLSHTTANSYLTNSTSQGHMINVESYQSKQAGQRAICGSVFER